ncbi:MAG: 23S rRNA (uracil(1939)-C(5))-methyltransferase RlmD [Pyramidobacter sp.]|jgi:23S rRNA (uracil1939-C5)-methyltransferase
MEQIDISRMNSVGQGIGRAQDGRTVFVDGALPGETAVIAVRQEKKSYIQARVERIVKGNPHRREPQCQWYRSCGGCQLQHADYELQCRIKSMLAEDALRRLGGFEIAEPLECVPSPAEWGYRNKAVFPVRARGRRGTVGFYKQKSHDIVPITRCPVIGDRANKLYACLRTMIEQGQFRCYDEQSNEGWLRHVVIRSARDGEELLLVLVVAARPQGAALASLEDLYDHLKLRFPELVGLVLNVNPEEGNVIMTGDSVLVKGEDRLVERVGPYRLCYDGTAFFQANPRQAQRLFEYAASLAEGQNILELYCGVGALTVFLAKKAKSLKAVEIWPSAVDFARENAQYNGAENLQVIQGAAEDVITDVQLQGVDCVVVDPPRAGCKKELLQYIAESPVKRVIYVSCNPATLARDAALLRDAGFALDTKKIRVFDMFPQTSHVETVCLLTHKD